MNTRIIMTATAGILTATGVLLTFVPEVALTALNIEQSKTSLLMSQIIGALYFGFGMLNWFCKGSRIGGIYNRPVAIGNFSHFLIAALTVGKFFLREEGVSKVIWIIGAVYIILAILFAMIMFTHPIKDGE